MTKVYVAGPMCTRSYEVEETNGIPLGVIVTAETQDETGMTISLPADNASECLGVLYAGDFKGKFGAVTITGTGVGTAKTQNTVANGDKGTVIMRGSGAVVECFASTTNISAGLAVKVAAGGSVAVTTGNEAPNQYIGTTLTAQASTSGKIQVLLNY